METISLDIVFTIDNNYLVHWAVALCSLLQNNQELDLRPHLVYDDIESEKLTLFIDFFRNQYGVEVKTYKIFSSFMDGFKVSHHINKSTYFRLCIGDILPVEVEKVLFLDCDIVINGSVEALARKTFDNNTYLYAVDHYLRSEQKEHLLSFELEGDVDYFNAGVMLIDLKKWRENDLSTVLLKFAEKRKDEILWWDQDVLNICCSGRWKKLHPKYNVLQEILENDSMALEIKEAQAGPVIIHYTRSVKPWHDNCWHPYKGLYWHYRSYLEFMEERI